MNNSFFRGFVRTKGKKCLEKFKNADLHTLNEVKDLPEYAGILAPDTVLIDIDDAKSAEKLLDILESEGVLCQVRQTTRGLHFFFKTDGRWEKCGTGQTLAIGLKADIKVGAKASYSVLKFDGKERPIVYDILEGEEYDAPPCWLRVVHTNISLDGVKEGEGRNEKLFRYIMPLQSAGLTKEEIRETLRIVNKYILDEPLSESEFETITRDESFETNLIPSFFEGKAFKFDEFAQYLIRERHVKRINGALHIYRDGVYVDGYRELEGAMIEILPSLSRSKRAEVLEYLEVIVREETPQADAHLVAFKNGILNVVTGELSGFSPSLVITNRIPWDYRKDAKCDLVDSTLRKLACGDEAIQSLLEEAAGYCLYRRNELRKAFIFTGEKSNGKSTYIAMILKMLGEENTSALDLNELGDRFKTAELFRKLANLGDDIGDEFISNTAMFKKLVSGERVTAERKGQDPFSFVNYSKFIFSANNLPRVKDRTGAVIDRLLVIPFNATFSKNDPDYRPFIKYELCQRDAIERLIALGVIGLQRVLENNQFTDSDVVKKQVEEYNEMNNPILLFFKELEEDDLCREPFSHWYSAYHEFCLSNQIQALSKIEFGKQLRREFPDLRMAVKKINGKSVKILSK